MTKRKTPLVVKIAAVVAAWIVAFSIDVEYDRRSPYIGDLTLVERVHLDRTPYVGMAESTGEFWLPIPWQEERIVSRRVMHGDTVLWTPGPQKEDQMELSHSPDGKRLLLWARTAELRWRLIDAGGGTMTAIPAMRPENFDPRRSEYPAWRIRVRGWSRDSRAVYVELEGTERERALSRPGSDQYVAYRELWTIDAADGSATRTQHCEQPVADRQNWDRTPCADDFGA